MKVPLGVGSANDILKEQSEVIKNITKISSSIKMFKEEKDPRQHPGYTKKDEQAGSGSLDKD